MKKRISGIFTAVIGLFLLIHGVTLIRAFISGATGVVFNAEQVRSMTARGWRGYVGYFGNVVSILSAFICGIICVAAFIRKQSGRWLFRIGLIREIALVFVLLCFSIYTGSFDFSVKWLIVLAWPILVMICGVCWKKLINRDDIKPSVGDIVLFPFVKLTVKCLSQ